MATGSFDEPQFDAHMLDEEITSTGALRRAIWACLFGGLGAVPLVAIFTFSAFDGTADTAGIGVEVSNFLGRPGAALASFVLQLMGWAAFPFGLLIMFAAARAVFKPRIGITKWATLRRSSLLVMTIFFLATFLAAFPIPQSWPMGAALGGNSAFLIRVFTWIGFVFASLAFYLAGYIFWRKISCQTIQPGWASLMVTSLLVGGTNLLAIGISGQYFIRILDVSASKPAFIIRDIMGVHNRNTAKKK